MIEIYPIDPSFGAEYAKAWEELSLFLLTGCSNFCLASPVVKTDDEVVPDVVVLDQ